jgi:outer membrane protein assembly factor BamE (lipoprotein component of BamABCDE complex)
MCLALSGCAASIGETLTTSDVGQFRVGVTPKQDVLKGLGTPDLAQIGTDNSETWTYVFGTRQVATLVEFIPAVAL